MAHKPKRDHFVPQLLIRQFMNADGRVFCFDKKHRSIPEREHGNAPKDILHRAQFYTDSLGNLDNELYKRIEREFSPHLVRLLKAPEIAATSAGFGKATIEWIAAQATRTPLVPALAEDILKRHGPIEVLADEKQRPVLYNCARIQQYQRLIAVMRSPRWRWRMWRASPPSCFVLGDHPVCWTTTSMAMGFMLLVPFSPRLMLVGGSDDGHEVFRAREIIRGVNGYIASWADRFVYSSSLQALEAIEQMFKTSGDPEHDEWMRYASGPFHGQSLRVAAGHPPDDFNANDLIRRFQ